MDVMNQAIQDGIGKGWIADIFMLMFHRQLTSYDSRGMAVSILDDLHCVLGSSSSQRVSSWDALSASGQRASWRWTFSFLLGRD